LANARGGITLTAAILLTPEGAITMADEVTKKDLQSLQGYVNNKVAELKKEIEKAKTDAIAVAMDVPSKQDEAISKLFNAITDKLDSRIAALERDVKALK
jgi:cell division protein ZapA (FtsZ GTPase activity inhibitor)